MFTLFECLSKMWKVWKYYIDIVGVFYKVGAISEYCLVITVNSVGVIFTEEYLVNGGKVAGTLEEESSAGGQVGTEARVVSAVFRVAVTPPACSGTNSWNQALNSLSPVSGSSGTKPWQATKIFENILNVYLAIQLMHLLCRLWIWVSWFPVHLPQTLTRLVF